MKKTSYSPLVLVLCGMLGTPAFAQVERGTPLKMFPARESLRGLDKVAVAVTVSEEDAQQKKILEDLVRTAVELKLRQNKIGVIEGEWLETPGYPMLTASVLLYGVKADGQAGPTLFYSSAFSLAFSQAVLLRRNLTIAHGQNDALMATTWEAAMVGYAPAGDLQEQVHRTVGELVDNFLNDYLTMNPK